MTKKEVLKWKLKDLPNGDEIAQLVEQKVITPEEARKILFNEEKEDTNQVAALKEEVKFLRDLVDTLASKHNGYTTIYQEYRRLTPHYPVWYSSYQPLMQTYTTGAIGSGTTSVNYTSTGGSLMNAMSSSQQTMKGLSSLN